MLVSNYCVHLVREIKFFSSSVSAPIAFSERFTDFFRMSTTLRSRNYHIIWIDVVKSAPKGTTSVEQKVKIEVLKKLISKCKTFKNALAEARRKDDKLWLMLKDTGDGYFLCFSTSVEEPYTLAIELQSKLKSHNEKAKSREERFSIRIGLNSGVLLPRKDILGNPDLTGDPLTYTNRVCNLGDE